MNRAITTAIVIMAFGLFPLAASAQTGDSGRFFPLHTVFWFNNYDPNKTVWNTCQIYHDDQTTVRTETVTVNGQKVTGLPIEEVDGTRALVLDATNHEYWNIIFLIGGGARVNLKRIMDEPGHSPVLHLRMKWGTVPPGNANDLTITMDKAALNLSHYALPSQSWQDINIPLKDLAAGDPDFDPTHVFGVKVAAANPYPGHSLVYISEMCVVPSTAPSEKTHDLVKVDQSGWRSGDPKVALVSYPSGEFPGAPGKFVVRNILTGRAAYQGILTPVKGSRAWNLSGDVVYSADFHALTKPGQYRIEIPSLGTSSVSFPISQATYNRSFRDSLRYFYYQRSGVPIGGPTSEGYKRPAVSPTNKSAKFHYNAAQGNYKYTKPTRDAFGGWLDAGDTSLQLQDHAFACWWLLESLDRLGQKVPSGSLALPEGSHAGVSDIAPLTDWGLQWMAKMQNADGSVLWGTAWGQGDGQQVADIDSPCAALLAGAFAKAYLSLRNLPGYRGEAQSYLAKAKLSWKWLENHPKVMTAVTEAPVDPSYDLQCRIFAAVELYNATGDEQYNRYFVDRFRAAKYDVLTAFGGCSTGFDPDHVMGYVNGSIEFAYMDYVESPQKGADHEAQWQIKQAFLHQAAVAAYDPTGQRTPYLDQNPYRFAMLFPGHLYWGSNANVLSTMGFVLTKAYEWTGDPGYLHAALDNLHFIQGRNPVNRDFVSGEAPDYAHGADFYSQFWLDLNHQPPGVLGAFISVDSALNDTIKDQWKRFVNYQEASAEEPDVAWNPEYSYLVGYFSTQLSSPHRRR